MLESKLGAPSDNSDQKKVTCPDCPHQVDVPFGSLNYAMTFNPSFPATLAGNFSRAVLDMEQGGTLDRLRTAFLVPASNCGSGASPQNGGVTFGQVRQRMLTQLQK